VVDAFAVEPEWLKVTHPVLPLPALPAAWDGVRIALLADTHAGPMVDLDYLRRVVARANEADPDITVLAGDVVSAADAVTDELAAVLGELTAPEGKFAVLGNHDYWTDPAGVCNCLTAAGFAVLTNAHHLLDRDGQPLCIAGVDDFHSGRPDLAAALAHLPDRAADAPRVLLAHNPDFAERLTGSPRVDLMLSGHTHGGQMKIPFGPRPKLPIRHRKYAAGLVRGPHCPVYVSVGLGTVGIRARFNCRPELAIVTLRKE